MFKKVFITGGSGHLGQELINYLKLSNIEVYAPSHEDCDITNIASLTSHLDYFQPDLFIHAAAFVDTFGCENDIRKALDINVKGTMNVVEACMKRPIKVVYISSEYVFGGEDKMDNIYTINDKLNPLNVYGKTKAAAEYIISILSNYQIIRAPFIKQTYPKVFIDQYCSRYFLEDVVPKIWFNIIENDDKLIHIANKPQSLSRLYFSKGIEAEPIRMSEKQKKIIPQYTGLVNNSL